jgi:hypothetical protein
MKPDTAPACAVLVLGLVLASCGAGVGPASLDPGLPAHAWVADLQVLARELPRRHANAFHTVSREEFDSAVAALAGRLPRLGEDSVYVGFRQIVTMIGDGHTNIQTPANWPLLPLRFRWFGDAVGDPHALELRVTQASADHEVLLGSRVIRVGDVPLADVYDALTTIIGSGETEGSSRVASTGLVLRPHILSGLGIIPSADSVRITVAGQDGQEITRWVRPVTPGQRVEWQSAAPQRPLYLTAPRDRLWFTRLPDVDGDSTIVYLGFSSYPGYFTFWRQTRALFRYIDEHHATRLVIDLRNNTGGDYNKVRRLLIPGLRNRPTVGAPGHLYVLIGPVTFSAAMTNAIDLRRELGAILVGEPTGARPNQYQETGGFTLPNSGLRVTVSTRYYRFQEEDTPGVLPDHHIAPLWDDWRSGRDPVLDWVQSRAPGPVPGEEW